MTEIVLDVPLYGQEMPLWCWAAVASAVSAFVPWATPQSQCVVASALTGNGCCMDDTPCNVEQDVVDALRVVGVSADAIDPPTQLGPVMEILGTGLPLVARIEDNETRNSHFVIVIGGALSGTPTVTCADPNGPVGYAAPRYVMRYTDFLGRYGDWGRCARLYRLR